MNLWRILARAIRRLCRPAAGDGREATPGTCVGVCQYRAECPDVVTCDARTW
jgi:hypothetical protein